MISTNMNRLSNTRMIKDLKQSCNCNIITARRNPTTAGLTCIDQRESINRKLRTCLHARSSIHPSPPTDIGRLLEAPPSPQLPRTQESDSRTVSEYFTLKVTSKVAILKSGLHQHLLLIYCCAVYIRIMLSLKPGVE